MSGRGRNREREEVRGMTIRGGPTEIAAFVKELQRRPDVEVTLDVEEITKRSLEAIRGTSPKKRIQEESQHETMTFYADNKPIGGKGMLVLKTDARLSNDVKAKLKEEVKRCTGEDCLVLDCGLSIERINVIKEQPL